MADIPVSSPELIAQCHEEYARAAADGGSAAIEACVRLAWALAHSPRRAEAARGGELAEALLHDRASNRRDVEYIRAVAAYRQRKHLEARRLVQELLQREPEFRQARQLEELIEAEIVKDGLVGVGAGVAILGVIGAIAIAAAKGRR